MVLTKTAFVLSGLLSAYMALVSGAEFVRGKADTPAPVFQWGAQ